MKKWVQTALEAAEQAKAARLKAAEIAHSLAEVTHALEVTQARVERALIKRAGGEKELAPTAADRERIFILAREADEQTTTLRQKQANLRLALEREKAALRYWEQILDIARWALQAGASTEA